jgi:hypothetical protein
VANTAMAIDSRTLVADFIEVTPLMFAVWSVKAQDA